ncbi:MAG: 4-(cytidine 5'-diphospho)-2-C-methyl-D-erythritol kinase [Micropruina sp.]|uniref:4-(cytidine 5'-diphospho)-2-C-methyl-D-erythritol kinase n=1 Tax=Micropruina sp. TaxID=2737536 RepID=UPI0039E58F47
MASPLAPEADWVRVRVSGKVNLALRVGAVRPNGYHPLATVFQSVSLFDEVGVRWAEPGRFTVSVVGEQAGLVPADGRNLAVKAAKLLAQQYGPHRFGADLVIRKTIPVAGGMAGGSANAAGALLACSVLWDLDTPPDELRSFGARLGADVPFQLMGGTALGTGRGDELVPVLSRGTYHWVLALSDDELSTPAVFGRFDELNPDAPADLPMPTDVMNALVAGDAAALGAALVNDLAPAAASLRPELSRILDAGRDLGALGAIVSGAGPTCAFLAANEAAAVDLSVQLSSEGLCRAVRRVTGPVPGARLITT